LKLFYDGICFINGVVLIALVLQDFDGIDFETVNGCGQVGTFVADFKIYISIRAFLPAYQNIVRVKKTLEGRV
jgi:hypothetical protein